MPHQVFGFLALIDVGVNGFSIVNLCVVVSAVVACSVAQHIPSASGEANSMDPGPHNDH